MIPYVFHLFNGNIAVKSIVIITLVWLALALGLAAWQMQKFVDFRAKHTLYTLLIVITVMAAIARSILVVPIVLNGNLTYGAFIMLQVAQHMQDLGLSLLPIAAVHFCFIALGKRLASGVAGWIVILSYLMAIVITLAWIANFFIVFYLISNALFFWFCVPYIYFGVRYFKAFGATFALYCCFHVLAIIFHSPTTLPTLIKIKHFTPLFAFCIS
ncbi:hypothetical protein BC940DRAFT_290375 [Gongronella butleri]|nr:hypothetical protein BC940DRAFT_290375 [Gongronella butleri]